MSNVDDVARLDLNLLAVFDALLRERSVTRAGQSLGVAQSSISHALARLRVFFDDPLFIKAQRGVIPSPKAESLSADITAIMESIRNDVLAQAKFDLTTIRRTFSLALSDLGELVVVPALMSRIMEVAPHCTLHTLQVPPDRLEAALASGEADLAIHSMAPASDVLYQQLLSDHGFVTIVGAKNRSIGETLTLEQFEQMPHVAVTLSGRGRAPYDVAIDDAGVHRKVVLSTPHFLFIPMLLDGHPDMIATVPRALGRTFERHGLVRLYDVPIQLPSFPLRQYWHPRFHHDRANKWLRGAVKDALTSQVAGLLT